MVKLLTLIGFNENRLISVTLAFHKSHKNDLLKLKVIFLQSRYKTLSLAQSMTTFDLQAEARDFDTPLCRLKDIRSCLG